MPLVNQTAPAPIEKLEHDPAKRERLNKRSYICLVCHHRTTALHLIYVPGRALPYSLTCPKCKSSDLYRLDGV